MVPAAYQGDAGMGNCLVALELSHRLGASVLMVMQNLHVIEGRPSFSSPFLIAAVNTCGRFSPLKYRISHLGQQEVTFDVWDGPRGARIRRQEKATIDNVGCTAFATDLRTGDEVTGPEVTIEMAVKEGWYSRNGSKWKTMPDVMLRYRAAAFFSRLYAPEITMGMQSKEEVDDVGVIDVDAMPSQGQSDPPPAPPAAALPRRPGRPPKNREVVVDAAPPPPPPPPAPPETYATDVNPIEPPKTETPPPAPPAAAATGLPRRTPKVVTPPPAKPAETVHPIKLWLGKTGVSFDELKRCALEFGMIEDTESVTKPEDLTKDTVEWIESNTDGLVEAIKSVRS